MLETTRKEEDSFRQDGSSLQPGPAQGLKVFPAAGLTWGFRVSRGSAFVKHPQTIPIVEGPIEKINAEFTWIKDTLPASSNSFQLIFKTKNTQTEGCGKRKQASVV